MKTARTFSSLVILMRVKKISMQSLHGLFAVAGTVTPSQKRLLGLKHSKNYRTNLKFLGAEKRQPFSYVLLNMFNTFKQGVTKRCVFCLSLLTNRALVYEFHCGGIGGLRFLSQ